MGDKLLEASVSASALQVCGQSDRFDGQGDAMRTWQDLISESIQHHILPPAALGSRHASLPHKCHAMLHSKRLECSDWHAVQRLLDIQFSSTSDSGVEQGITLLDSSSGALFPYWLHMHFQTCSQLLEVAVRLGCLSRLQCS